MDDTISSDRPLLQELDGVRVVEPNRPQLSIEDSAAGSSMLSTLELEKPRKLTALNGLALVIGFQIGSGIFAAPSQISQHVPSPGVGVLVWLVGGLLVWTGAASFIELGLAIRRNGGIQEYLLCCYGDFVAFLFTWLWVGIAKPAGMAIISTVFADHLCRIFLQQLDINVSLIKTVGILGIVAISAVNCAGATSGVNAANLFLVLKLGALVSVALLGIVAALLGHGDGVRSGNHGHRWFDSVDQGEIPLWTLIGNFVTALFGALFCYSGWDSIGFVVGDLANPANDLPKILNGALSIVIVGFTLMNISLYLILPMDVIRDHYTAVVDFGAKLFGTSGTIIYSLFIAVACLGALNANIIALSALCVAASQRQYFARFFANLPSTPEEDEWYQQTLQRIPLTLASGTTWLSRALTNWQRKRNVLIYPTLLSSFLAIFYIVIGTFNGLITFIGITTCGRTFSRTAAIASLIASPLGISEYVFFFLAVIGVFIIRRRERDSTPAYRTHSANPIIFCAVSVFVVARGIITDYMQGVAILGFLIMGWLIFRLRFRGRGQAS